MSKQAGVSTQFPLPRMRQMAQAQPLIQIVEDHEDTRVLFAFVMEQCGYRVVQASDGIEAVQVAERTIPDLMLMDTTLPRVDGLAAARCIRNFPKLRNVPIIFVSGHAQPEARAAALAIGRSEYLIKPIKLNELEIAVKRQLAKGNRIRVKRSRGFYQEQIAS